MKQSSILTLSAVKLVATSMLSLGLASLGMATAQGYTYDLQYHVQTTLPNSYQILHVASTQVPTAPAVQHNSKHNYASHQQLTKYERTMLTKLMNADKNASNLIFAYKFDNAHKLVAMYEIATLTHQEYARLFKFFLYFDNFISVLPKIHQNIEHNLARVVKVNYMSPFKKMDMFGQKVVYFDVSMQVPTYAKKAFSSDNLFLRSYVVTSGDSILRISYSHASNYGNADIDFDNIMKQLKLNHK